MWRRNDVAALLRSSPRTRTVPAVGRVSEATMRISVVLPAPLGPKRVKNSPSATAQVHASQRHLMAKGLGHFLHLDHRRGCFGHDWSDLMAM